ncbi:MAG: phage tail length tape measure family protein [Ottowia sp.]|uniref:phage tail length tape measure family protein n=1 Tax=Ottowia sp. TaxID=1898956 RepID=UPI003C748513
MSTPQLPPIILTARDETAPAFKSARANLSSLREEAQGAATALSKSGEPLAQMGMSAKATAAAMRQVPAQVQDIVVSLQGGQAPLTVMLQQGSQLSTMFGGAGAAAKALGIYVSGLVNPFTVAAAAVAGLGVAMYEVEGQFRQQKSILAQLEATGRGALLSSEQLSSLRKELRELPGVTKSFADATISEFARTRQIGGDLFGQLSRSVADFAAATGQQIPDAAKTLAKAFADPAQGAKQLDEQLGILNANQLVSIQNMVDMGDKAGAQKILMDGLHGSIKGLADDALTPLGKATDDFGNAWDQAMGGMDSGPLRAANELLGDMVGAATWLISNLGKIKLPDFGFAALNRSAGTGAGTVIGGLLGGPLGLVLGGAIGGKTAVPAQTGGATGSWDSPKDELDERVKSLLAVTSGFKSAAREMENMRGTATQLSSALKDMRAEGKSNTDAYRELEQRLAGVNERIAKIGKSAGADARAALNDSLSAQLQELKNADKAILDDRKKFYDQINLIGKLGTQSNFELIDASLAKEEEVWGKRKENFEAEIAQAALKKNSAAEVARITGQMQDAERDYEQNKAKLRADELIAENNAAKALDDRIEKQQAVTRTVQEQVQAAERQTKAIGLTGDALREFNKEQLENSIPTALKVQASWAGLGGQLGELGKAAQAQIQGMRDLSAAQGEAFSAKLVYDYKKGVEESHRLLQAEIGLMGLSSRERNIALEQIRIRLDLEKKIDEIKSREPDAERRDAKIAQAQVTAATAEADAVSRVMLDEWKQSVQQYDDIFRQGFADMLNNGKDGWKSFNKSLVTTFKTTVADQIYRMFAQPIVIQLVGSLMGLTGLGGSVLSSVVGGSGGSGVMGMASNGMSAYNIFTSANWMGASGGLLSGLGTAYGNATLGTSLGMTGAEAYAASQAAAIAGGGSVYGSSVGAAAGSGTTGSLGAGGAGWAALPVALAALGWFGSEMFDKGDTYSGAAYASSGGNDPISVVRQGLTNFDPVTGDLPDRDALITQLLGYGANSSDLAGVNDRSLLHLLRLAENEQRMERDGGPMMSWDTWIRDGSKDDFYRGPGYANPEALNWWDNDPAGGYKGSMDYLLADPAIVKASRALSEGILAPLDSISQALGLESDFRVTTGMARNDKTGNIFGGLAIQNNGQEVFNSGKQEFENQNEYLRATFANTLSAFDSLDLPQWAQTQADDAKKKLDELKPGDTLGSDAAAIYSQATSTIAATINQISSLIKIVPELGGASQDAVYNIGQAMGSLDNFVNTYSGYVQNYYSDSERSDYIRAGINDSLSGFDLSVSTETTREQFRAMVEAQDLTTESGQKAFAALMQVAGAFAEITPAVDELTQRLQAMGSEIGNSATDVLREGLLGNLSQADLGGQMADAVIGGVYNALAGNAAQQISAMMTDGLVTPLLHAAMTGSSISEAISQASISSMVANAKAAADALGAVFNDPAFKDALKNIDGAIRSITASMPTTSYYSSYANQQRQQQQAQSSATKSAADAVKAAQDAAYDALQRAIGAEKTRVQTALDAAREIEQETKSLFDFLGGEVRSLYGQVDSTAAMQADQGRKFVEQALAAFNATGSLPEEEALREAVDAVRTQLDGSGYARVADQEFSRLVLAGQLDTLRGGAETQLSAAEEQVSLLETQLEKLDLSLDAAKDQLDALRGIDNSVLSVADAIKKWNGQIAGKKDGSGSALTPLSISPLASFAVGTNYVPYDMTANIHRGERIVPEADNAIMIDIMRRGAGNDALVAEIQALKAEVSALRAQVREPHAAMSRMAKQFENVTDGGNSMRSDVMNRVNVKVVT